MNDYRVFVLDAKGHIFRSFVVRSPSPADARIEVQAIHGPPHGFEIWQGDRLLAQAAAQSAASAPRSGGWPVGF